ncbi:class I SAM-dependent methyltransferase [Flexilinea flocculi]|nr:class I SAM-dependent methyltransferase [Flexilinea flocculi]
MCPCCSSLERHRLLYDYLENHTDIFKESCSILHFAAEGNIKNKLFENTQIDYYSADIVKNRAMYQVDITKIPFPSQKFDYVLCNHVLQDIEDDRKAIMEMKRVLKSNGTIILSFPLCISQHNTYEDMEKNHSRNVSKHTETSTMFASMDWMLNNEFKVADSTCKNIYGRIILTTDRIIC